ncbi:MAG TPA: ABC transporter substrate-binding protein [Anaerolineae bacterium]|nr:ABC transporter substrate-binding protein [Anaerolineae bacterium]
MSQISRSSLRALCVIIIALVLAACATPAVPATSPTSAPAQPTSAPAAPSSAPSGGLQGTLTVGLTTDAESMDPYLTKQSAGLAVSNAMFDNLIERDFQGKLVPGLATSWSFVDDKTIEFKLRQGVKFHNGEDFDANSVKFSLERMQNANLNSPFKGNFKSVQAVNIVDPYTVRFALTKTDAALLDFLSAQLAMLPPKYTAQVGDAGFAKAPIGTGPFKFVEWVKDDHITVQANENYWAGSYKGKPMVQTVIFRPIPEASTRIAELTTGNVDLIQDVAPDQAKSVQDAGFTVDKINVPQEAFVFFVTDVPNTPLADKRVRQALNYGVNVDSIIQNVLQGYATRFANPIGPLTLGYDANIKPYPYDPDKAKALLTEAGYPNGFEVTIDASASDKTLTTEAVAGELAKIGVKANVRRIELAQFNDNWDKKNTSPMVAARWSGMFDPSNFLSFLVKSDGFLSRYKNPQADALVAQGVSTLDPAARAKTYQQLGQLLYDDPIGIYLWLPQNLYGVGKRVQGWQPHPNSFIIVSNTSVTQ